MPAQSSAKSKPASEIAIPDTLLATRYYTFGYRDVVGTKKILRRTYFFTIIELMTDRRYLGEFELMILLAVVHLGDQAYGVPISRELEIHRGRDVSVGSVYAALERLEAKGLVSSILGDPTPERGGKAKRFFRITKEGLRQVHETRRVLTKLWQTLPQPKGERA
jgi:DNA-binding PadR family transcriptional regulator